MGGKNWQYRLGAPTGSSYADCHSVIRMWLGVQGHVTYQCMPTAVSQLTSLRVRMGCKPSFRWSSADLRKQRASSRRQVSKHGQA